MSVRLFFYLLFVGIVGAGFPYSCDQDGLDAAIAAGGYANFSCGRALTIPIQTKQITKDIHIDGGALITFTGTGFPLFNISGDTVKNVTFSSITLEAGTTDVGHLSVHTSGNVTVKAHNTRFICSGDVQYPIFLTGGGTTDLYIDKSFLSASGKSVNHFVEVSRASLRLLVTSSTFAGTNTTNTTVFVATESTGALEFQGSTVAFFIQSIVSGASLKASNSIFTTRSTGTPFNVSISTSDGNNVVFPLNLFENSAIAKGDQLGVDPLLVITPATVRGSYTEVYQLQNCSPAINAADKNLLPSTDQLGTLYSNFKPDVGAFESATLSMCVSGQPLYVVAPNKTSLANYMYLHLSSFYTPDPVRVNYAMVQGTALKGEDYTSVSGSVTFRVGKQEVIGERFTIIFIGQNYWKPDLIFWLSLDSADATVLTPSIPITITTPFELPQIFFADTTNPTPDEGGLVCFRIILNAKSASPYISAQISISGTAQRGVNYNVASQNITFAANSLYAEYCVDILHHPVCEVSRSCLRMSRVKFPISTRRIRL